MRRDLIGHSEERRPIWVQQIGEEAAPLRILIVSGQHGDEHRGWMAVQQFADAYPVQADQSVPVTIALVPNLNPDGEARHTRTNARGVDLNRDHLRLTSAETRALHRFVRAWRPHLVVDVHRFRPRRRPLLARQLAFCHDVFLDVPTHPAAQHPALGDAGTRLLQPILSALNAAGYRSARYTRVTESGRVRHSTGDIFDARNGLALRYQLPTVLVEGRRRSRGEGPAVKAHVLAGMQEALRLIVQWAQENHAQLTEALPLPASVPIRARYRRASGPCTLEFADLHSGLIRPVELPGRFTPHLETKARVNLPRAYAVPRTLPALVEVLRRHAFALVPSAPDRVERIERYWVNGLTPSKRKRSPRKIELRISTEQQPLHDYLLLSAAGGGPALAVLLEPASKYGLARFADIGIPLAPQSAYPILRVL